MAFLDLGLRPPIVVVPHAECRRYFKIFLVLKRLLLRLLLVVLLKEFEVRLLDAVPDVCGRLQLLFRPLLLNSHQVVHVVVVVRVLADGSTACARLGFLLLLLLFGVSQRGEALNLFEFEGTFSKEASIFDELLY